MFDKKQKAKATKTNSTHLHNPINEHGAHMGRQELSVSKNSLTLQGPEDVQPRQRLQLTQKQIPACLKVIQRRQR